MLLCPGQLSVQRLFQPGSAAAFCIQIADQMLAQRNFCAAPCRCKAAYAAPGKVAVHFQQKRCGAVAVPVQKCLPGTVRKCIQACVVVFAREAEGKIPRFQPGEKQAAVVVEAAPPGRQREPDRALCFGPGSIGMVLCQKIQAAQNYRKPQQNSCIQRQYPFAGHLLTPF